jgi:glycerol-3-phosphate acyltransferase PlsY
MGKFGDKIDIREHGSGNAGTTNAIRVFGFKAGAFVFLCDFLKGVAAYAACYFLFSKNNVLALYGGIGAVLGHNFPFYMHFKGGKGVATTLGLILFFDWRVSLISYGAMLLIIGVSRYISLASLFVAILIPALTLVFGHNLETISLTLVICLMTYFQHRSNIKRLITGAENKIGAKQ